MLPGILRRLELQCFSSRRSSGSVFRSPINQRSQVGVRLQSSYSEGDVIFSGIQPTGVPHLGNYLGALQQWTRMQNDAAPSTKLLYSIVDLHAITLQQDANQLRRWKRETLATLLASGLDPDRCTIFYQSTVPEHTELMWILSCTASVGYLSRMTQWKSKLALSDQDSALDFASIRGKLRLGLFSYPVLQAADILLYGATHVPIGEDQTQHLEFARECATKFNRAYGEILVEPRTILSTAKRVMSLREPRLKMSKSHQDPRSRIQINDNPQLIRDKIRVALTDSMTGVSYDPANRPGLSNLLDIMSYLDNQRRAPEDFARLYHAMSMRELKIEVTKSITEGLASVRDKYNSLMESDGGRFLDEVGMNGTIKARREAEKTMSAVRRVIGL
ncbi:hypothetical protein N7G274_010316 [Stereocaulon virgatum]|uniref:tryptophan--tRNA ligase n=1 Tax=Stereocaulon virgatum TaxID=373712 RepID=A0ABR3ZVU9_9LECA